MTATGTEEAPDVGHSRPRSVWIKAVLALAGIALFFLFVALGWWQVQRLAWKEALILRVTQRLHSAPTSLPARAAWPQLTAAEFEYQPVQVQGRWQHRQTVLSQATTELGAGYWVLTALQLDDGSHVFVNRGFVPAGQRASMLSAELPDERLVQETVTVQGLLRASEPGGGYLRRNDPVQQRWYSRDVAAIAQAQGLGTVAPFFIDAGLPTAQVPAGVAEAVEGPWPRPGMTVVRFANSHLVYALTWFGLALLVVLAAAIVVRYERRLRARPRTA